VIRAIVLRDSEHNQIKGVVTMNQISSYRDILKQYFKEKQRYIPHEERMDRIVEGETTRSINDVLADERMTMTDVIEIIKRDFPEDLHDIARAFATSWDQPDPDSYIRESNIRSSNQAFGMDLPFELLPGIPEGFSFDAFLEKGTPATVKQAWSAASAWGQGDPGQDSKPILVLAGPPGVGKTHLAAAAAWALAGAGKEIAFRTESQIMADIRSSFNRHDTEDVIASYSGVLNLIWDDLGLEAMSDTLIAARDQIVNNRWMNAGGVRTLFTSNLLSQDLPPRLASRLSDKAVATNVRIDAPDYRRRER